LRRIRASSGLLLSVASSMESSHPRHRYRVHAMNVKDFVHGLNTESNYLNLKRKFN
jgi:hypothetical protein